MFSILAMLCAPYVSVNGDIAGITRSSAPFDIGRVAAGTDTTRLVLINLIDSDFETVSDEACRDSVSPAWELSGSRRHVDGAALRIDMVVLAYQVLSTYN